MNDVSENMNRFGLVSDVLINVFQDIVGLQKYPGREISLLHANYWFAFLFEVFSKGYFGSEFIGGENIPEQGSALVAANHLSHLDGLIINAASISARRRPVVFLAAADVYESNIMFRAMCDLVNCIPVKRDERDMVALRKTVRLLKDGGLFGIFPEGQRSRDGKMGEVKEGVVVIAMATGSPVVPVGLTGTFEAFPRKTKLLKPAKIRLKVGQAIELKKQKHPSQRTINTAMNKIVKEISRLYSDVCEESRPG